MYRDYLGNQDDVVHEKAVHTQIVQPPVLENIHFAGNGIAKRDCLNRLTADKHPANWLRSMELQLIAKPAGDE